MARNQRDFLEEGNYYHLYNKVVSKELLFRGPRDYNDFIKRYQKYFGTYFNLLAYCLIPNHFHLLIQVTNSPKKSILNEKTNAAVKFLNQEISYNDFLENQFSRMLSGYSLKYNKKYNRVGPLFKQGIRRVHIRTTHRLLYILCYIHHNPIHHYLTSAYEDWPYSSYAEYLNSKTSIVDKKCGFEVINSFSHIGNFTEIHAIFKSDY